ncbi:SRPBCC domain-containing protein [Kribbella lupini]|uniref:Activator of Hsp90 ATPase homologue 1/2-like C-terminal domain-containing protein n=1 Tax=Kribbella lupini TaxID=291602 RepID=A0ABP4M6A3_9ACTN
MPDLGQLLDTARTITHSTDHTYAVVLRRTYEADIQDVWSAWTTPSRLSRWLGQVTGTREVGGTVHLTMSPPDQDVATVQITTCNAPTALQAHWTWPGEPDSTVDLHLEPAGSTTILTLTHSQVTEQTAVQYGYGWEDFLNRLTNLLADEDPAAVSWSEAQQHLKPLWEDLFTRA